MDNKNLKLTKKKMKENEANLKKLAGLLREELYLDWVIHEGKLMVIHRHLPMEISNIEDVKRANSKYGIMKYVNQCIIRGEFIMSHPRNSRITLFEEMAEDIYEFHGEKYYFQLLGDIVTDINEFGNQKYTVTELFFETDHTINYLMDEDELEEFNKLPENLTIYRGVALKNPNDNLEEYLSHSWTLDFEIAKWFANRYIGYPVVFKYQIKKDNVLAYFAGRNESEIFINYEIIDFHEVDINYLF